MRRLGQKQLHAGLCCLALLRPVLLVLLFARSSLTEERREQRGKENRGKASKEGLGRKEDDSARMSYDDIENFN